MADTRRTLYRLGTDGRLFVEMEPEVGRMVQ